MGTTDERSAVERVLGGCVGDGDYTQYLDEHSTGGRKKRNYMEVVTRDSSGVITSADGSEEVITYDHPLSLLASMVKQLVRDTNAGRARYRSPTSYITMASHDSVGTGPYVNSVLRGAKLRTRTNDATNTTVVEEAYDYFLVLEIRATGIDDPNNIERTVFSVAPHHFSRTTCVVVDLQVVPIDDKTKEQLGAEAAEFWYPPASSDVASPHPVRVVPLTAYLEVERLELVEPSSLLESCSTDHARKLNGSCYLGSYRLVGHGGDMFIRAPGTHDDTARTAIDPMYLQPSAFHTISDLTNAYAEKGQDVPNTIDGLTVKEITDEPRFHRDLNHKLGVSPHFPKIILSGQLKTNLVKTLLDVKITQLRRDGTVTNLDLDTRRRMIADHREYVYMDEAQRKSAEERTREQGLSPLWHALRPHGISSTLAHSIANRIKVLESPDLSPRRRVQLNDPTKLMLQRLTKIKPTKPMKWGTEVEPFARAAYERLRPSIRVSPSGLVIAKSPHTFLRASPDGMLDDDGKSGTLEIKCIFSARGYANVDDAFSMDKKFPHLERRSEAGHHSNQQYHQYFLKRNHPYYTQVQVQMFCTDSTFTDFVTYIGGKCVDSVSDSVLKAKTIITRVPYDKEFMDALLPRLISGYIRIVLPFVGAYVDPVRKVTHFSASRS